MSVDLTTPAAVMERLSAIENDLAQRQNLYEAAAMNWYRAKRDREHKRAIAFIRADGTVAERNAQADTETSLYGKEDEALYEGLKAVIRTLEARASIGQSLLRAQGRS